jgi:hypothetical protein
VNDLLLARSAALRGSLPFLLMSERRGEESVDRNINPGIAGNEGGLGRILICELVHARARVYVRSWGIQPETREDGDGGGERRRSLSQVRRETRFGALRIMLWNWKIG